MTRHGNNGSVMRRAWAIFRETYRYPAVPFRSIGRRCFASALRMAWAEARRAAELAATPVEPLTARIAALNGEIDGLKYLGWSTDAVREERRLRDALAPLVAELASRPVPFALAA